MQDTKISIEVHCSRPPWAVISLDEEVKTSRYRLYINNDLITERTWRWDNVFLLENVWVATQDNYEIKLEPVVKMPEQAEFKLSNPKLSDEECEFDLVNDHYIKISK
jgi:hypothetical protein